MSSKIEFVNNEETPESPPNLNGQVSEANSSTVEVIVPRNGLNEEAVIRAVEASQVNLDANTPQLVVCPAPIDAVNQEQLVLHTDIVGTGTGDAAQAQPRIRSLNWFLLSVAFNVAFLACLILLLDKKVFNNIAPAFMAYKKNLAFFQFGFIITGSAICHLLSAILISVLNIATGRWVGFLVKAAYVLAHEVVLYRTKDIILAHLVYSFHGCSFICFMKFMTPQDNKIQLIKVCTMEFARSALRFSFHSKWMSAGFFLFTAFIGFLAMGNFDLMKNIPDAAGEVADNIAVIV